MKIIYESLDKFEPWSGAVSTLERIKEKGKIDDLESNLEDAYPNGLTETELNDLLWFESDSVFEWLGIQSEEDEERDERIEELEEKKQEYILNESSEALRVLFPNEDASWRDVADAEANAESKWDETGDGKELKALLNEKGE